MPGPGRLLGEAADAWLLDGRPAAPWQDLGDAAAVPLRRAALASAPDGSRAQLRALLALVRNVSLPDAERKSSAERAAASAAALHAPAAVRAIVGLMLADPSESRRIAAFRALLADPVLAADPLTTATLRLMLAAPDENCRTPRDAITMLDAVIDAPGLPARHPLKVNALLRKTNLLAAGGDVSGADAAFRQTGLNAEQYAMSRVTPVARSSGASSGSFPMEAMRWGFDGRVRTEFVIATDGRTVTPRALISCPPFVFDDAATGISRASRWTSSYRPEGSIACAASHQSINFVSGTGRR